MILGTLLPSAPQPEKMKPQEVKHMDTQTPFTQLLHEPCLQGVKMLKAVVPQGSRPQSLLLLRILRWEGLHAFVKAKVIKSQMMHNKAKDFVRAVRQRALNVH